MRKFIVSIIMLFVFCFGALPKAQAQNVSTTPVGQWNMLFYFEPDLRKAEITFSICFASNGTWSSPPNGLGNGDWFQKGDRIRFYGRLGTSSNLGFAAFGQFNSNLQFAGEMVSFRIGPSPVTFNPPGNFIIYKVSNTCQ